MPFGKETSDFLTVYYNSIYNQPSFIGRFFTPKNRKDETNGIYKRVCQSCRKAERR